MAVPNSDPLVSDCEGHSQVQDNSVEARRSWLCLVALYGVAVVATWGWSAWQYWSFANAWPWDLAHVNQMFFDLLHGLDRLTIRPDNYYAIEGPEPWRSVHLSPLRFLLFPAYCLWPRVETLLAGHVAVFWLSLFAVARLQRAYAPSSSRWRGVGMAALWLLTPGALTMAVNDCRPLQLGLPFFLWALAYFHERRPIPFLVSALLALAARQEYGAAVLALALLPGPRGEHWARSWRWRVLAALVGCGWLGLYGAYLAYVFSPESLDRYLFFVTEERPGGWLWTECARVALEFLWLAGCWIALACASPRHLLASVPFLVVIVGRGDGFFLPGEESWHFIRYAAIPIAFFLAGGVRCLNDLLSCQRMSRSSLTVTVLGVALLTLSIVGVAPLALRQARIIASLPAQERKAVWQVIQTVPATAVVWADEPYTAALSGRYRLYCHTSRGELKATQHTEPLETWFLLARRRSGRRKPLDLDGLQKRGFRVVYAGISTVILQRDKAEMFLPF